MKRSRLGPLSGLFFTAWQGHEKTVDESFDHSRHYADAVTQTMLEGERLEQKKASAEENKNLNKEQNQKLDNTSFNSQNCL
jgi:hypothetical protein